MPARKQRAHDPMLNMAGNPVVDLSHQDMHPRSQYEPMAGYYHFPGEDEPRGQGMLFHEKPYAKGYGPERSMRVDAALRMAGTTGGTKHGWREPTPEEEADFPYSSNSVRGSLRIGTDTSLPPSADLVEHIKRSTVPPEHLLGLNELRYSTRHDNMDGASMHYVGSQHAIVAARAGHAVSPKGPLRQYALVHEVGHHAENMEHGLGGTPEIEGTAEAYAGRNSRTSIAAAYLPKHMAAYDNGPARFAATRERFGEVPEGHPWHDVAVQARAARATEQAGNPRWERYPHPTREGDTALRHVTDTQGELF